MNFTATDSFVHGFNIGNYSVENDRRIFDVIDQPVNYFLIFFTIELELGLTQESVGLFLSFLPPDSINIIVIDKVQVSL
jgi:hypothetical protein